MALLAGGAAAVSAAGAATSLFQYNRENFKYDRLMRQRNEFKVLDFRALQAGMWREDVHDIMDLTEKKMEAYLVVNTIQMGMVLTLFTEGRLDPGTPQWCIRFYMISLGSAFMYLLMSVWLALQASVVAQTSATRLLTQFVRIPVPTQQFIDKMRTYLASFENVGRNMLRIPFMSSAPNPAGSTWNNTGKGSWASRSLPRSSAEHHSSSDHKLGRTSTAADSVPQNKTKGSDPSSCSAHASTGLTANDEEEDIDKMIEEDEFHYDCWQLEERGDDIIELQEREAKDRPHISMIKDEAVNWQCHDTFSRVTMSFGTQNLVISIVYYCMGYICIQDGAVMAAWCVAAVMVGIVITLVDLDFRLTAWEQSVARLLILTGPCCVAIVSFLVASRSKLANQAEDMLLPIAYLSHAAWLIFSLERALGIKKHGNGAWLPMKYCATAYIDVFGWYQDKSNQKNVDLQRFTYTENLRQEQEENKRGRSPSSRRPSINAPRGSSRLSVFFSDVGTPAPHKSERMKGHAVSNSSMDECDQDKAGLNRHRSATFPFFQGCGFEDSEGGSHRASLGTQEDDELPEVAKLRKHFRHIDDTGSHSGEPEIHKPSNFFEASTCSQEGKPYSAAGWCGVSSCDDGDSDYTDENPLVKRSTSLAEEFHGRSTDGGKFDPGFVPWKVLRTSTWFLVALWCSGPVLMLGPLEYGFDRNFLARHHLPSGVMEADAAVSDIASAAISTALNGDFPALEKDLELLVDWPRRNSFSPRTMSCDPSGKQLVLADDFGVYTGNLFEVEDKSEADGRKLSDTSDVPGKDSRPMLRTQFVRTPPCTAFEGQALKDIGVVCMHGFVSECRVLVLHANGRRLTECPLQADLDPIPQWFGGMFVPPSQSSDEAAALASQKGSHPFMGPAAEDSRALAKDSHRHHKHHKVVSPVSSWTIAKGWLHVKKERVESMAVNSECRSQSLSNGGAFVPEDPGCLVVGTTFGRVVQLRRHATQNQELVPAMSMQHRPHSVNQGSLHVLPGGIVMALRPSLGTVQALDVELGGVVGEWRLPTGISWITLCGGGGHFYMLGRTSGKERRLLIWRFPVPKELKSMQGGFAIHKAVIPPPSTPDEESLVPSHTVDGRLLET